MLVLSRQRDESIMIGDDVEITVVDVRGEKVRLGINAPPHIPVHRKEVYEAIKREKLAAAQGGTPGPVESLAKRKAPPTEPPKTEPPKTEPSPQPPSQS
jgi:carbon storage regulator